MRNQIRLAVEVVYMPATKDGFVQTLEHFVARTRGVEGDDQVYEASDRLRHLAVQKVQELVTPKIVWPDVVLIQETLVGPEEAVRQELDHAHEDACREEERRLEREERSRARNALRAEVQSHLGAASSVVRTDGQDRITICGIRSLPTLGLHGLGLRSYTIQRERHYNRRKDGTFNWERIKHSADFVHAKMTEQGKKEDSNRSFRKRADAMMKTLGISPYSGACTVKDNTLEVLVKTNVANLAKLVDTLRKAGFDVK